MGNKTVIISGGDKNYFEILCELIDSVLSHKQSESVDLAILDAGLAPDQAEHFANRGVHVFKPDWPCDIAARRVEGKEFLKACVCRPFLNTLLPGYEVYIWLDGDTWLQDWEAIELYEAGARKGALACTVQVDRGYPRGSRIEWLGYLPWRARGFYFSNAKRAFSYEVAKRLFEFHTIQAGAFALHNDAPHWQHWQALLVEALKKGKVFTAEQLTMGVMVHLDGLPAEFLPAWCNWIHVRELLWDDKQKAFVEPYLPHHRIGLLHLTGLDDMRKDSSVKLPVRTTDGESVSMSFRYGGAVTQ